MAWWSAEECGGFDLTDLWNVDAEIRDDMVTVFARLGEIRAYTDRLGLAPTFDRLMAGWRPHLQEKAVAAAQ